MPYVDFDISRANAGLALSNTTLFRLEVTETTIKTYSILAKRNTNDNTLKLLKLTYNMI